MDFASWCHSYFGQAAPDSWLDFLKDHRSSIYNGTGGVIWDVAEIIAATEERELAGKGVCIIGTENDVRVYLLRVRDGRIFAVDRADYQIVDAWFSDIDVMTDMCQFERT
ncbi:hypothetical protein ACV229_36705 [Burkholderia sp. MR1-5-21]